MPACQNRETTAPCDLEGALALIDTLAASAAAVEPCEVAQALGRWLAEDVLAAADLPRFACAAMDGYAIRAADLGASDRVALPISQSIAAGQFASRLQTGTAARILTGARIPEGADRVVMQEDASPFGDRVTLRLVRGARPHVRPPGEDVARGQRALRAGTRLGAGEVALLTALGHHSVPVRRRPRVAVLSTGDELVPAGAEPGPAGVVDTNGPMLRVMLAAMGAEVTDLGICRDDRAALTRSLIDAAAGHDLILTSGGASVGLRDHMTALVRGRGFLEFWKLAMRPGKPVGFGDIDDCPTLVLPGNPVAAAVDFALLGRPLLARLMGLPQPLPGAWRLPFDGAHRKPAGRTDVLLARLVRGEGGLAAQPITPQGSANLMALAQAEVLVVLTPDRMDIDPGEAVQVVPLWDGIPRQAGWSRP